jgi:hypothetical protein
MLPRLAALAAAALVVAIPAALAATFSFRNSVTADDPDQKGQLVRDDPQTTCGVVTGAAIGESEPTNYDLYRFRNASSVTTCVKVELAVDPLLCPVNNPLQSAAYSPEFDSADITANYLGDIGTQPEPTKAYSFNVPPGESFDVTVNETNPNAGCNSYGLTVEGAGITGGPTSVGAHSFTWTRTAQGVLLRWRTGSRVRPLGFNVYAERSSRRTRLNRTLITGSRWLTARIASRYWLQVVQVDGSRRWHGPARLLRN